MITFDAILVERNLKKKYEQMQLTKSKKKSKKKPTQKMFLCALQKMYAISVCAYLNMLYPVKTIRVSLFVQKYIIFPLVLLLIN